MTSLNFDRA